MATQLTQPGMTGAGAAAAAAPRGGHLFGPIVDFLCLGGASLAILPVLALVPVDGNRDAIAFTMLMVAHLVNHPHFAHSYQIFYGGFRGKAFGDMLPPGLRARYRIAGIAVPLALIGFFLAAILSGDARLLGYGGNLMGFFVGWHYVKQGYGMLMVDAALKRRFFDAPTKQLLLVNCYAVWAASWLGANALVSEHGLWGLEYYSFAVPPLFAGAAATAAFATTATVLIALARQARAGGLPVNGVVAYGVSLYAWLLFVRIHPLWVLVVPALHSLQYLLVVWRFQANRARASAAAGGPPVGRAMARFSVSGVLLGFAGFWALPVLLIAAIPYDHAVFGETMFLFVGWIFINVHHYFLDNVMWRRENPETRKHLFG